MGSWKEILGVPQSLMAKSRIPSAHTQGTRILLPQGHPCSGSGAHPSVEPLLLQPGLAPSAGGSHCPPFFAPTPVPGHALLPCPRVVFIPKGTAHTPFSPLTTKAGVLVPGPAGPGGWPGGRGSPHLIPSDGSVQHLPLLSARSLRGGPEPLGTSCPPGLALPELVACPGPWKKSSVWPLSHTQDRVKTWRRPASAPAFLPGDGRQLSPRGQASPAQSGPHGLRRDWPVWSQSTPSSFHPLWPTYHLKQGLWGGTQESAFHHGPALRLGTIRSRILGHSGCLASVIVGRGQ